MQPRTPSSLLRNQTGSADRRINHAAAAQRRYSKARHGSAGNATETQEPSPLQRTTPVSARLTEDITVCLQ